MTEVDAFDQFPRELLEHGSDVFFRADVDGRFEYLSPNVERILGWTAAEMLGHQPGEYILHDDSQVAFDAPLGPGVVISVRGQVRRRDGRPMWFENRILRVFDDAGNVAGFAGVFRDIDQQMIAEIGRMKADDQFRLIAEHASDVVVQADSDGIVRWVSPSVAEALGRTPDELEGFQPFSFVDPRDHDEIRRAQRLVEHGGVARFEIRFLHADGRSIWHSVVGTPLRGDDGEIVGRVASWRNIDAERQQREALRESEERYRLLAENASDVVVQIDGELVLRWASPSFTEVLGWPVAEAIGRPIQFLLHADDRPVLEWSNEEILAGRPAHFEARYRTADGRWVWMSVVARPITDASGAVVGRVANWRNIDAEHRHREALRESEERYRLLAENASDIVAQIDNEGLVTWLSPSTEQILLHHIPDLIARPVTDIVHPDDLPTIRAAQERALRGETSRFEARYRRGDDSYIWMSVAGASITDEQGNVAGRVASARNIDAERRAREALAASEEQLRFLVDNVLDIVIRTQNGEMVFVSPSVERVLGWTPDDIRGRRSEEFIHPDDWGIAARFRQEVESVAVSNVRLRVRHRDGDYRWIEITASPVASPPGETNNVAVLRDVSERVAAEDALAAATAEAQAANLAKTAFLSRMSHELRTPLNAVLGFAQLLAMDPLSGDQRSAVEQIMSGGRHLLELINEVLDIARIESGRMTLSPEVVAAGDVVSECLDLVRPLALGHGVVIERFDPAACADQLFVDRQRTIQILINLVSNAIKYNRVGGRVRVRCEHVDGRPDLVVIAVADDGIGIAPENLPRLFSPFERLGAASTGVEGTGIGLALSRGLAEMMGGSVSAESTEGVGSVFRLTLPTAPHGSVGVASGTEPQHTDASAAPRSVLYLEDNPANAMLMRTILGRRGGVDLVVCNRGADALDRVFSEPPDLMLLDLHLPDIAGAEVLRRIRTDPRTATLPVVVLTADAAPQVRQQLVALGADAFLAKPVDIGDVLSWVDDPLQGRRS